MRALNKLLLDVIVHSGGYKAYSQTTIEAYSWMFGSVIVFYSSGLCFVSAWYQLDMEDGDEIDAMLHQTGGGHASLD
jgi:hypothetical protein